MGVTPCSLLTVDPSRVNSLMRKKIAYWSHHKLSFRVKSKKVAQNDVGCRIILKIWQIMKHFARRFHQAKASYDAFELFHGKMLI